MPNFSGRIQHNNPNSSVLDINATQVRGFGIFNAVANRNAVPFDVNQITETPRCVGYLAIMKDVDTGYIYLGQDLASSGQVLDDANWTNAANWQEIAGNATVGATGPTGDPGTGTMCGISLYKDVVDLANIGDPTIDGNFFLLDSNEAITDDANDVRYIVWEPSSGYNDLLEAIIGTNFSDFTLAFYGQMLSAGSSTPKYRVTTFRPTGGSVTIGAENLSGYLRIPVEPRDVDSVFDQFRPGYEITMCSTYNGDIGESGIQGETGVKGDTGDQGPIGPDGPAGEQGIQGLEGGCNESSFESVLGNTVDFGAANAQPYNSFNMRSSGTLSTQASTATQVIFNTTGNALFENANTFSASDYDNSFLKVSGRFQDGNNNISSSPSVVKYRITSAGVQTFSPGAGNLSNFKALNLEFIGAGIPGSDFFVESETYTTCIVIGGPEGGVGSTGSTGVQGATGLTGFPGGCGSAQYEGDKAVTQYDLSYDGFFIAITDDIGDEATPGVADFQVLTNTAAAGNGASAGLTNTSESLFYDSGNPPRRMFVVYPAVGNVDLINSGLNGGNSTNSEIAIKGNFNSTSTDGVADDRTYNLKYDTKDIARAWPGTAAWKYVEINENVSGIDPDGIFVYPDDYDELPDIHYIYCYATRGPVGPAGPSGVDGVSVTGATGESGTDGQDGQDGADGADGAAGISNVCVNDILRYPNHGLFIPGNQVLTDVTNGKAFNVCDVNANGEFIYQADMTQVTRMIIHPDNPIAELMLSHTDAEWQGGANLTLRGKFQDGNNNEVTTVWNLGVNSKPTILQPTGENPSAEGSLIVEISTATPVGAGGYNIISGGSVAGDEYLLCFLLRGPKGDAGPQGGKGDQGDPGAAAGSSNTFFDNNATTDAGFSTDNKFNIFNGTNIASNNTKDISSVTFLTCGGSSELAAALQGMTNDPDSRGYWGQANITMYGYTASSDGGQADTSRTRVFSLQPTGFFNTDNVTLNNGTASNNNVIVLPVEFVGSGFDGTTPTHKFLDQGGSYRFDIQFRGPIGPDGQQGEQGEKGDNGDTGQTGETGPPGPEGGKGDTGDQGDTGAAGQQGATGGDSLCSTGEFYVAGQQAFSDPFGDVLPSAVDFVVADTNGSYVDNVITARRLYFYRGDFQISLQSLFDSTDADLDVSISIDGSYKKTSNNATQAKTPVFRLDNNTIYNPSGGIHYVEVTPSATDPVYNTFVSGSDYNLCIRSLGTVGATGATGETGAQGEIGPAGQDGGKGDTGVQPEVFMTGGVEISQDYLNLSSNPTNFSLVTDSNNAATTQTLQWVQPGVNVYTTSAVSRYLYMGVSSELYRKVFRFLDFNTTDSAFYYQKAIIQVSGDFPDGSPGSLAIKVVAYTQPSGSTKGYEVQVVAHSFENPTDPQGSGIVSAADGFYFFSASYSEPGETGPQGETGDDGPPGPQGGRGDTGASGLIGPVGPAGTTGAQGGKGDTGADGETGGTGGTGGVGPEGERGEQGEPGPSGPQGPQGDQGPAGPQGPAGVQGEQGATGSSSTLTEVTYRSDLDSEEDMVSFTNGLSTFYSPIYLNSSSFSNGIAFDSATPPSGNDGDIGSADMSQITNLFYSGDGNQISQVLSAINDTNKSQCTLIVTGNFLQDDNTVRTKAVTYSITSAPDVDHVTETFSFNPGGVVTQASISSNRLEISHTSGGIGSTPKGGDFVYSGSAGQPPLDGQYTVSLVIAGPTGDAGARGASGVDPNSFTNYAVAGQDNIVADNADDTMTIVAGSNVTLTTDAASDTLTIAASAPADLTVDGAGTIHANNVPTLNQNTTGTAAGLSSTLAVASGGTGQTTLASNSVLTGDGVNGVVAESNLTFDGSKLFFTGLEIFSVPDGADQYYGEAVNFGSGPAGVNGDIAQGKLYYLDSSQQWEETDADAASTSSGMIGIAVADDTARFLVRGFARSTNFGGLTTGDILYVSTTTGEITNTAPSGNGDIVRVAGYCVDGTNRVIYFDPDKTFIEVTA